MWRKAKLGFDKFLGQEILPGFSKYVWCNNSDGQCVCPKIAILAFDDLAVFSKLSVE